MYLCDRVTSHVAVIPVILRLCLDHLEGRRVEGGALLGRDGGELPVRAEVAVRGENGLADVFVLPLAREELPGVLGGGAIVHAVG